MLKRSLVIPLAIVLSISENLNADFLDLFSNDSLTNGSRFAFVPSMDNASVIAIDTVNRKIAAELVLPHLPGAVAVSEKLDLLFVTDPDNESVTIVFLGTKEIVKRLNIGMRGDAVLLNPFDRYVAFGSRDGSVSVWDMLEFKEMVRVDGLDSAENITFSFDGRNLYVVEERKKLISVIEMYSRGKVAEIKLGGPVDPDAEISAISRSADGFTGFVSVTSENRVAVLDLLAFEVKKSIPAGRAPVRPYSTADNRYILIPNRDDESLTILSALSFETVATIPTQVRARELHTGWLDTVAFVMPAAGNKIAVVDLDKLKPAGWIELAGRTDDGLVTSDTKMLFTSIIGTGDIVAIDARSRSLAAVIKTPSDNIGGIEIAISNNICH